ncbi:MAG: hypothetical protein RQ833_09280 [Sphingomonadaceae bacterium]|nr:hypothetical protein [Sphingomonadaceae bacterium]
MGKLVGQQRGIRHHPRAAAILPAALLVSEAAVQTLANRLLKPAADAQRLAFQPTLGNATASPASDAYRKMAGLLARRPKRVDDLRQRAWIMLGGKLLGADKLRRATGFSGRPKPVAR